MSHIMSALAKANEHRFCSKFGIEYTDRNFAHERSEAGHEIAAQIERLDAKTVLEIGCNSGDNLADPTWWDRVLIGTDVQSYALEIAKKRLPNAVIMVNNVLDGLPFLDSSIDVVFTCGVLIHIPPADLHYAISEMWRVARIGIIACEYQVDGAAEFKTIDWRGQTSALWKGDYFSAIKSVIGSDYKSITRKTIESINAEMMVFEKK